MSVSTVQVRQDSSVMELLVKSPVIVLQVFAIMTFVAMDWTHLFTGGPSYSFVWEVWSLWVL